MRPSAMEALLTDLAQSSAPYPGYDALAVAQLEVLIRAENQAHQDAERPKIQAWIAADCPCRLAEWLAKTEA